MGNGPVTGAVSLVGNQYVNVGSKASLDNIGPLTVCVWVNLDKAPALAATVADKSANGYVGGWKMYVQAAANNQLGFLTNMGFSVYGSQSVPVAQWTHVCASWDGTTGIDGIELYVNSVKINVVDGQTSSSSSPSDASHDLVLGRASGLNDYPLNGKLDEFILFDHALSEVEIQVLHSCAP